MAMRIHQPIPETAGRVVTPDGPVEVLPYQIVVMVSIAATRVIALPADAPRFPAVLDTGNNHNFAIRHEHLDRWTGLSLPKRGLVIVGGRTIPLYAANVWIHPEILANGSACGWKKASRSILPTWRTRPGSRSLVSGASSGTA
jgi:hypothetical protein